jgi:hypothetical protein
VTILSKVILVFLSLSKNSSSSGHIVPVGH